LKEEAMRFIELMQKLKDDPRVSSKILSVSTVVFLGLMLAMLVLPSPYSFYAMAAGLVIMVAGSLFDVLVIGPFQRRRMQRLYDDLQRAQRKFAGQPEMSDLHRLREGLQSSQRLYVRIAVLFIVVWTAILLWLDNRYVIGAAIVVTIVCALVIIFRRKQQ
jgi:type III secretory pathway component EscU